MAEPDRSERRIHLLLPEEQDPEEPLELGGFLTPQEGQPTIEAPTEIPARDLKTGQAILFEGRPYKLVGRTDSLASSGPLAARHKIALELVDLFSKEALGRPLDVRATEKLQLISTARSRYTVVCMLFPSFLPSFLPSNLIPPSTPCVCVFVCGSKWASLI